MAAAKKKAKVKAKSPPKRTTRAPATKPAKGRGGSEPRLSEELQIWVVTELATFRKPTEVAETLKTDHGIELTRQSVQHYDPTSYAGRELSEKLSTLFFDIRRRWLDETTNISIAGKAERLRRIDEMETAARGMKNFGMAKELLREAREEMAPPIPRGIRAGIEPANPNAPPGQGGARFTIEFVDAPEQANGSSGPDQGR